MKTLKEKRMRKGGQTEIIVTVLLILIAIAAVAAIAYFIVKNVKGNVTNADLNAQCTQLMTDLEITKLIKPTLFQINITIKRGTLSQNIVLSDSPFKVKIVNTTSTLEYTVAAGTLNSGEEKGFTIQIPATVAKLNDVVEIYPVLKQNSFVCPKAAEKTYTV